MNVVNQLRVGGRGLDAVGGAAESAFAEEAVVEDELVVAEGDAEEAAENDEEQGPRSAQPEPGRGHAAEQHALRGAKDEAVEGGVEGEHGGAYCEGGGPFFSSASMCWRKAVAAWVSGASGPRTFCLICSASCMSWKASG